MPIISTCPACGKSLKVKDELIGRRLRCPQCGETFEAAPAPARSPTRRETNQNQAVPKIHLSPMAITFIALAIALPTIFAAWHWGPDRIQGKLDKLLPDAQLQVQDVVTRAIQAWSESELGFGTMGTHLAPRAFEVNFLPSPMYLSMPASIGFVGTTAQGAMHGKYSIGSGEIVAEVDIGGISLPGTGPLRRGKQTIHVTGRDRSGVVSVEVNGTPIEQLKPKFIF